jgi:hypothetical protein
MSKIQVTADVYAEEILSELSADEIADELLDRMNSTRLAIRRDAAKAITKLGFASPTPQDLTDMLDDIEKACAQGDRMYFGVLMHRLRCALDPAPPRAVQIAMTAAAEAQP